MDLSELQKERKIISDINVKGEGNKVTIVEWVYDSHDLGKVRFLVLH